MSLKPVETKRIILPRWRNFKRTTYTGELSSLKEATLPQDIVSDEGYQKYKSSWLLKPQVDTAADFIFYCATFKRYDLCKEQAEFLKAKSITLSKELNRLIEKILVGDHQGKDQYLDYTVNHLGDLNSRIFDEIHRLKVLVTNWPKNAIYWVELARLYAALGVEYKASKSIEAALHLSPDNRYVLRSAIRYLTHIDDYDALSSLFKKTDIYRDPWITSAFVALHDELNKKTFKTRNVRALIDSLPPLHTTELVSALASLELDSGALKSAKKLFRRSVLTPNDNSLAQVSWAQTQIGVFTDISDLRAPFDHELRARECFVENDVQGAIDACIRWVIDEPFSALAPIIGSFISATHAEDYQMAKQFCEVGLRASPNNKMLINNSVVCEARLGNLDRAVELFSRLGPVKQDKPESITFLATAGLLYFRSGDVINGREFYNRSIALAKKYGIVEAQALAAINLAREEFDSGHHDITNISKILDSNMSTSTPKQIRGIAENLKLVYSSKAGDKN